jgi:nitroimidazol reductase NimA-like FMN-containing flavoprotein (pyridoxamine 5'-phosphate oxidase superfamily)
MTGLSQDETMTDFSDMARGIIESNRYMVLGTADAHGVPWVTPVWFAQSDHQPFVWVSSAERRHSRNIGARRWVSSGSFIRER